MLSIHYLFETIDDNPIELIKHLLNSIKSKTEIESDESNTSRSIRGSIKNKNIFKI